MLFSNTFRRAVDKIILHSALKPTRHMRNRSAPEKLDHKSRLKTLEELIGIYKTFDSGEIFPLPKKPLISFSGQKPYKEAYYFTTLKWHSRPRPLWRSELLSPTLAANGFDQKRNLQEKIDENYPNQIATARWYRSSMKKPKAIIITLHGYAGGFFPIEKITWPIEDILKEDIDIINLVLPYHGTRRLKKDWGRPPKFPASDQRFTIEAVRQTVHDYRILQDHLRESHPNTPIITVGMSLGGYCASLLACLDNPPDIAIPVIPLACIASVLENQNRLKESRDGISEEKQAIIDLLACIDPTRKPLKIPKEQITVIAGADDRITGLSHANILVDHFGCELCLFNGGHTLRNGFKVTLMQAIREHVVKYTGNLLKHEKTPHHSRNGI